MYKKNILTFVMASLLSPISFANDEFEGFEFNNILTSTRLKTTHRDAPASISIITAEDIETFKYRNIPEALKTVPGFFVAESHSSYDRFFVGYHGGNSNVPRRTNLIIDGISYYQSGFARVNWEQLPISMSNISRIEIIRGPAASLYGSNSFTSVINIVSKKPKETLGSLNSKGISINARAGQSGIRDIDMNFSFKINDLYSRLTFRNINDDGFDVTRSGEKRHDSLELNQFDYNGSYKLDEKADLDFSLGHSKRSQEEQFIVSFQTEFADYEQESIKGSLKYTNDLSSDHNVQIFGYFTLFEQKQVWNADVPAFLAAPELTNLSLINSDYANLIASGMNPIGSGGSLADDYQALLALTQIASIGQLAFKPINLDVPQNYSDNHYEIEFQDTYSVNEDMRLLTGFSVSYVNTDSFNWVINGKRDLTSYSAFINTEFKIIPDLLINTGAMYEYDSESGSTLSPRFALSYYLDPRNTFRFVYSQASRTPDIFEQFADWKLIGQNYSFNPYGGEPDFLTFYARAISPGSLSSEKITSNEIGYLYNDPSSTLELDIRVFKENLTRLISEKLSLFNFNPTNNGYAEKVGVDIQSKIKVTEDLDASLSYSYVDIDSVELEKSLTSRHILSAAVVYNINSQFQFSARYYGISGALSSSASSNSGVSTVSKSIENLDLTLQWNGDSPILGNLNIFIQTKIRNSNPEIQPDNIYTDNSKTVVGFTVDF